MKAAVLQKSNAELVVGEVRAPDRLDYGQVRVRVHYSGLCGSQIGEIDAVKGPDRYLPHLLGHEGSATVMEAGPGVTTVAPGDRVVMHWRPGEGIQARPAVYEWEGEALNAGWVTTLQEEAVVSENRVTQIPPDFDLALAPLLGCAVTTGLGVVSNDAQLRLGESVVVIGTGGVGLCAIQGAALAGAHPIVAVDLHRPKLDLARALGATHVFEGGDAKLRERILEVVGSAGADAVIENTGIAEVMELAHELTGPQGRTVLVGVMPLGHRMGIYTLPLHFGKRIVGSHGGDARPAVDIPRYLRMIEAGKLALEPLVTDRYRLEEINRAIGDMRAGRIAGRPLIALDE